MTAPVPHVPSAATVYCAPSVLQEHFTRALRGLADWEQYQILASLQRVVALMEARDLETSPFLATGPLDASSESLESFLDPESES